MKRLLCLLAFLVLSAGLVPRAAIAQANEPFLGEIQTFAFNFCPAGWAPLDGQLLSISQYTALFSLLGTNYGGDGVTTFALPKWGRILTANGGALLPCIALTGVFPSQN
ncbi:MAG: tail fiber protein [Steroidobacteraceae bacterium]